MLRLCRGGWYFLGKAFCLFHLSFCHASGEYFGFFPCAFRCFKQKGCWPGFLLILLRAGSSLSG